ncbi:MAG: MCE family protein [Flavobacteriaceae bacterium]|nr:MCE family protein [Flavobacteriaceae bacterium]
MKNTSSEKFRLGIFVVISTIVFVVAVYLIGQRQNMFNKTFSISAYFQNVNGLQNGNNVRYSGIDIGTVKAITMINDSTIKVDMDIQEKIVSHIKKDAIATIGSDGLVGNMIVNIVPGRGSLGPISNDDVIESYSKLGADDILSTLSVTGENTAILTAKLLKVADALADGEGTLGMLINDTIVASNLKQTVIQLRISSIEASKAMKELNSIISTMNFNESVAGALLNDSLQGQKVKSIISNLDDSSKDLKGVINNLNETLTNIKDGEGALNYLSNDEDLVRSIEQTMKNINEGTDKFNQNMEALKHNFLTRGYFKKLERQERKEAKKTQNED